MFAIINNFDYQMHTLSLFQTPVISSPMNFARTDKIDKQLQTRGKTTPKVF